MLVLYSHIDFMVNHWGSDYLGWIIDQKTPAHTHQDGIDFVPSRKGIVFGHHFTSIAGTGQL